MMLMQTDLGDTRFNNYVLEHGYRWLLGDELHKSFWDPPFFWPERNVAAYSDILLGVAPIYWAFRLIGIMPDTSFQLWMILIAALNYIAMFALLRWGVKVSILAACGGAYLFAFSASRAGQLGHQALLPHFFTVLALLCLFKFFEFLSGRKPGSKIAMGLFWTSIVLQFYVGFYLAWFLVFGLSAFFAFSMTFEETRREVLKVFSTYGWWILSGSVCSLLAMSWMGYHYYLASLELGGRPWAEVSSMVPRITSWLYMGSGHLLYGWLCKYTNIQSLPAAHEHAIGIGLITPAACCYGLWAKWRIQWVRILAYSTLCIVLLAMTYPFDFYPWKIVWKYFPGASAIRAVTRIGLLLLIPFGIAVGLALNSIRRWPVAFVLLALICAEQAYTGPYYNKLESRKQIREIASQIRDDCSAFYYIKEVSYRQGQEPVWKYQIDAMWVQMEVSKPTLNGYSGNFPRRWNLWDNVASTGEEFHDIKCAMHSWADLHGLDPKSICLVNPKAESD